jgi:hypothetical protein
MSSSILKAQKEAVHFPVAAEVSLESSRSICIYYNNTLSKLVLIAIELNFSMSGVYVV